MTIGGIDTATLAWLLPLAALVAIGVFRLHRSRQQGSGRAVAGEWLQAPGTVVASTIQVHHAGNSRQEKPVVMYVYQVGGQQFQGNRLRVGDITVDSSATQTVARYPAGAAVSVYYDPANPAASALER